jgi:peroxiredoxin
VEVAEHSAQIDADIAVVTFSQPNLLRAFEKQMDLSLRLYADPQRTVYRAFGFERGSRARVWLDPRVLRRYAQLLRRGRRLQRSDQDTLQLGGDVVIDRRGRLAWIHRSEGPEDRPTVDAVATAVRQAA